MASLQIQSLSSVATTFRGFPNLPLEIRNYIWKYALPGPRIVYVRHVIRGMTCRDLKRLEDYEVERRENNSDSEFVADDQDVANADRLGHRPLPRGFLSGLQHRDSFGGAPGDTMQTEDGREAKKDRHGSKKEHIDEEELDFDIEFDRELNPFAGWCFKSYCPVPGMLHTCRESAAVASKVYQKAFRVGGISPVYTYFDFDQDIIYVDEYTWRAFNILSWQELDLTGFSHWNFFQKCDHERLKQVAIGARKNLCQDQRLEIVVGALRVLRSITEILMVINEVAAQKTHADLVLLEPFDISLSIAFYGGWPHRDLDYNTTLEEFDAKRRRTWDQLVDCATFLTEDKTQPGKTDMLMDSSIVIPEIKLHSITTAATAKALDDDMVAFHKRIEEADQSA